MSPKHSVERIVIDTIVGPLTIGGDDNHVRFLIFGSDKAADVSAEKTTVSAPLREACTQLDHYFRGNLKRFDLPLMLTGTEFQKRVWQALGEIEYGQVLSYGQLAGRLGNVHLARAVGQAANKNPLPVIIPCHRLVGSSGWIGGFAPGVELKKILLDHEGLYGCL